MIGQSEILSNLRNTMTRHHTRCPPFPGSAQLSVASTTESPGDEASAHLRMATEVLQTSCTLL